MRFWIECTRFETGQTIHINIALVGSMWRDGERTVLAFVGGDGQTDRGDGNAGADRWRCISARRQRRDVAMTAMPDNACREALQPIFARIGRIPITGIRSHGRAS